MLVVNATIESTEADIEALKDAVRAMETASRAEAGCDDYTFAVELSDPTRLRITERWADEAALRAHFQTPHMAAFGAAMAEHAPKNMSVHCYEVNEIPLPRD